MKNILELAFITFVPALELRASIPYGILVLNLNWVWVGFICLTTNIILGILVFLFLESIVNFFCRFEFFSKLYQKIVVKTQRRIKPYVERFGAIGIALFIGVPLPGSGVYTGALGASLLGLNHRQFFLANVLGVLIAGSLVTIATLSGRGIWQLIF